MSTRRCTGPVLLHDHTSNAAALTFFWFVCTVMLYESCGEGVEGQNET